MSEFFEGQAVTVRYNGKHGVVTRVINGAALTAPDGSVSYAPITTIVVQVGDRSLYLKPNDVRPQ